ncbi:hypothetical protein [Thermococcus peptonophilus]|uniref:Uncharacterized protein n=1 Tax=Thermococcus peptonophilus TaxID=53952 RepID=A0A142CXT7_9EURY|nr:hypothetical protein [Thermococcus peptonophilus]AMQ19589.1 hypothetical protein A0127_10145 [Thermococcus peptonophilus]
MRFGMPRWMHMMRRFGRMWGMEMPEEAMDMGPGMDMMPGAYGGPMGDCRMGMFQGMGGMGPMSGMGTNFEEIKSRAKEALQNASKGTPWQNFWGPVRIPIIINGQIAGQLWEDVDLKEVEIGTYVQGMWGTKVQLLKDGRVVGFLGLS